MCEMIAEDGSQRLHRLRLEYLIHNTKGALRVASAYVTDSGLLTGVSGRRIRLLTSLSSVDIMSGATSIEALLALVRSGVKCRRLPDCPRLHAKVYIFGSSSAVVTSANLTRNALDSNIEVGVKVEGASVPQLTAWFDGLWAKAYPLGVPDLTACQRATTALCREYLELRGKACAKPVLPSGRLPVTTTARGGDLHDLLENAPRFFVCNTDRRYSPRTASGYVLEEEMHRRCYAAAWETFKFPTHLQMVERGDAVLMFAKGVGIIGVGRATGGCQRLVPGAPDRIREKDKDEWRVPVDWLVWQDDEHACPYRDAQNFTFWNVTGERYSRLRKDVRDFFLRDSYDTALQFSSTG
jgi:hypothetical protein